MAVISELIRTEENGKLSFGDYTLAAKAKLDSFEKDGDIYTTNWINGVSTLTKYNEETGKIQRYEESVGMFGYLH